MFKRLLLSAFVLAATGSTYASSGDQVAMQESPVVIKEGWSYTDCGMLKETFHYTFEHLYWYNFLYRLLYGPNANRLP